MSNYKFRNYLFDWDGCLGKTLDLWMEGYLEVYKNVGLHPTRREIIEKSWGNWEKGPENFGVKNVKKAFDDVTEFVNLKSRFVKLYEGVEELLTKLKEDGSKICLVSSSKKEVIMPALKENKIYDYFDNFVTADDISKPKPDPECIDIAIKRLGVTQVDTVMIGDSEKDILSGRNAKVKTILVLHQSNSIYYDFDKLKATAPDYIVENLLEILSI